MVKSADVVIVGAGIIGCSIAYYLTREGCSPVILERETVACGATGRCGAGVRQQWGTEMNCILAKGSVDIFKDLGQELDFDIEFRQGGYLVLASSQAQIEQYRRNVFLQNRLGIPSRLLTPEQAREIVPVLNIHGLPGATFCPTDGHANPFATTFAYAKAAKKLGATIEKFTEVTDIVVERGRVVAVETTRGRIATEVVVNAAGGYSAVVGRMAGLVIPTFSERHEILVSEPLEPLFEPMVISFTTGLYCQQVPHGSIIMGMGDPDEPESFNVRSSWQFIRRMTREVLKILPILEDVRVVRQWAGLYNKTPDAQPILGESQEVRGFFMAVGFSGHGFMIAPMTAKIMTCLILRQAPPLSVDRLGLERFERGELVLEPSVVG